MGPASLTPRSILLLLIVAVGCGGVPDDPGARIFPPKGVIRGTVSYRGPHPCSRAGHIVGNAIILVFDRRSPPPPTGFASEAVNFADVTGDALFGNEPRYTGSDLYCPVESGITDTISASAPFVVAPIDGGSYELHAFFDYTGNFLPEFTIRDLPEQGDIGGGDVDTVDALEPVNAGNPNYLPDFLPIDVGVPQLPSASTIPDFVIPDEGFVADNVSVTIGAPLASTRPYFYAQGVQTSFDLGAMTLASTIGQSSSEPAGGTVGIGGATETDPNSLPILTIPQDIGVLAPPLNVSQSSSYYFESQFPHIRLAWGVPVGELAAATGSPFNMQVAPFGQGPEGDGLLVWQSATLDPNTQQYVPQDIAEGSVPRLWPQVVLTKLAPSSMASPAGPIVVILGITLLASQDAEQPDSLYGTAAAESGGFSFRPDDGPSRTFPSGPSDGGDPPQRNLLSFSDEPRDDPTPASADGGERRPRLLEFPLHPERRARPVRRAARLLRNAGFACGRRCDRLPADRPLFNRRRLPGWSGLDRAKRGRGVLRDRRAHGLFRAQLYADAAAGALLPGDPRRRRSRRRERSDILSGQSVACSMSGESVTRCPC